MQANKYDYIMHMFTENDRHTLRKVMLEVNKSGEHLYASNNYSLIKMPASLTGIEYTTIDKYPDAKDIIYRIRTESVPITRNFLMKHLAAAKLKWKQEDGICSDCKGTGETVCPHCGNETDCDVCDGEGKREIWERYADFKVVGKDIEFMGFTFDPYLLNKLVLVLFILDVEEAQMRYAPNNPMRGISFELPEDIQILLMPKDKEE